MKKSIKATVVGLASALLLGAFTTPITSVHAASDVWTDENGNQWVDGLDDFLKENGLDEAHKDIPRKDVTLTIHTNIGDIALTGTAMKGQTNVRTLPNDTVLTTTEPDNDLSYYVDDNWNTSYDGHTITYQRRDGKPLTDRNIASLIGTYDPNTDEYILPKDQEKPVADGVQVHKIQTITTPKNISYISLYAVNGTNVRQLMSRALSANSAWYSDKKVTINGEKYYRVATNEWAKANDVLHPQD